MLSENVALHASLERDITYSEIARSLGADMILLNGFDTLNPIILGMYGNQTVTDFNAMNAENIIRDLKKLVGSPIGVNLESVDKSADMAEDRLDIATGRQATETTFKKANDMEFDFICLTGNPVVAFAHEHDVLVMSAIGTSQESSEPSTIQQIALANKMLGVDIQCIGYANVGIYGLENIKVLSDNIRGTRHTMTKMARSVNR